ncbi:MAG TPA: MBL fold metallo-hydrolase [Burkholderiales bacterium]|nr:MBL fold metallo-hydrolase [Burkholderiales bacterium]
MGQGRIVAAALAAAALAAAGGAGAQYSQELGKLAPEALKPAAKSHPPQLKRVAPDLYFYWNDGSSNSAFLVTEEGVLVIDTQQHPADARRLLSEIRRITDKPIRWAVVTHAHGDHFLGNPVFKAEGAVIVSHRDTRGMMQKYYTDEVKRRLAYFTRHNLEQGELELLLPEVTFDSRFTIHLGGRTVELMHLGPGQNPGDTLIHFPHARTLFMGGPFSRRNWSNYSFTPSVEGWIALLRKAAAMDVDIYLGGHGDVATREDVLEYAQMHQDFLAAVRAGIAQGKSRDELADTIRMEQYSHFRNYHRMRGWVYALHHLLTTGKPMAPYP